MKDIFVGIESLRNSYDLLHKWLGPWIQQHLSFVPDDDCDPPEALQELWHCMGLEHDVVEVLTTVLRLKWADGFLQVAASCSLPGNLVETVSYCLLSIWHFRQFSDSRWVTVGCSCRTVMAAWLTGLPSLVASIRADAACSDFHIHGFARLQQEAQHFMAMASMVSYISDSCLTELLEDPRVPLRQASIKAAIQTEVEWLASVSDYVWDSLAGVIGGSAGQGLRSDCLRAAHISVAFLEQRLFSEASKLPWSLVVGDKEANLAALKKGPEPTEPTSAKIWQLLQRGFNTRQLVQGLELLGDCSWGTASAEQQHASATIVKKHHQEYSSDSLMLRALAHAMRHLWPQPSREDKQIAKLQKEIASLESRKPQHYGGRQLYLKDLIDMAKEKRALGRRFPKTVFRGIMRRHGQTWGRLPESLKEVFEARATLAKSESQHQLSVQVEEGRERLALLQARREESQSRPLWSCLPVA